MSRTTRETICEAIVEAGTSEGYAEELVSSFEREVARGELRDMFASDAMNALLAQERARVCPRCDNYGIESRNAELAKYAYAIADAMITQRKVGAEEERR